MRDPPEARSSPVLELIARPRRGDVDRRRRDRPRLTLEQADRWRDTLIAWAQGEKLVGFLFVVAICAAAALIAAWLVRRFSPQASGSGIPQATASLNLNHGKRFKFD
jgi:H+/Cl- antiporter ClcA